VIPAFVLFLLCFAPHPVLGFPTGINPVGFEGRIHNSGDLFELFLWPLCKTSQLLIAS